MRNIKFRAYIKDTNKRVPSEINKIVEVKSLHLGSRKAIIGYSKSSSNYGNYSISFDDIELMQYTGLHDKNGKEIYEGDIVEWAGYKMEVFWGEDIGIGYGFCWRPCGDNTDYHESMTGFIDEYEVIGNIYDNPELLEKGAEDE